MQMVRNRSSLTHSNISRLSKKNCPTEIVQAISISRRDEMTVTLIGGLRFTEML